MPDPSASSPVFSLEHAAFAYPGGRTIFADLNLDLAPGRHLGLFGGNGEGKTTLFRLITGLEKLTSGRVLLHGEEMRTEKDFARLRRSVGLVLQQADDQLFCPTVLEDVSFGPLNLGLSPDEAREKACSALRSLGLAGFEDRLTHRLSGGEKKLVSLAGVLAMEPEAILFDEPTAALDERAVKRLAEVLADLSQARIVVSHDRAFLESCSDALLLLSGGTLTDLPAQEA
ncbi:MAG: ABC transporter ATP-binding protein [Desulfovibrionaceae bacterium]|nr:ABC transporter ATP-binding protein [Desulfovibrionaceae bacterium]